MKRDNAQWLDYGADFGEWMHVCLTLRPCPPTDLQCHRLCMPPHGQANAETALFSRWRRVPVHCHSKIGGSLGHIQRPVFVERRVGCGRMSVVNVIMSLESDVQDVRSCSNYGKGRREITLLIAISPRRAWLEWVGVWDAATPATVHRTCVASRTKQHASRLTRWPPLKPDSARYAWRGHSGAPDPTVSLAEHLL